jgi:hypothetical protein
VRAAHFRRTGLAHAFADPDQLAPGVSEVLVNGKVTIGGGEFTGELAGRALAGPGARR